MSPRFEEVLPAIPTPVGLHAGDPDLLPKDAFRPGQAVYDLIYTRPRTAFLGAADQAGNLADAVNIEAVQAEQKGLVADMDLVAAKLAGELAAMMLATTPS